MIRSSWQDPSVLDVSVFVYNQITIFLLGFLSNHVITKFDIEWSLITRKRPLSPVLIPFLLGRYSILIVLLTLAVAKHIQSLAECKGMYRALALLGSTASFCSTLNLNIRTYIIWKDMNKYVVSALAIATVGHATLAILQSVESVAFRWDEQTHSCTMVHSSNLILFIFYLYTILMDFTVLLLTLCGLWKVGALSSTIGIALSEQCLWYCIGTFLCNIPAVIMPLLNLNAVMNVMASASATTLSVIISSSAVLSLETDVSSDACTPRYSTEIARGVGDTAQYTTQITL